ncbi:MAG: hypothetical protein H6Q71_1315 [Firmicutes bacterium]|nr:hypothetical protein [Bacillota bacterium]
MERPERKAPINYNEVCYQLKYGKCIEWQIENLSQGAIMAGINVGKLKSIIIEIPPLDLQNQFAAIVEKTEQQKALMQRAFKGELFS